MLTASRLRFVGSSSCGMAKLACESVDFGLLLSALQRRSSAATVSVGGIEIEGDVGKASVARASDVAHASWSSSSSSVLFSCKEDRQKSPLGS